MAASAQHLCDVAAEVLARCGKGDGIRKVLYEVSVAVHCPLATSHSRAVLSSEPVATTYGPFPTAGVLHVALRLAGRVASPACNDEPAECHCDGREKSLPG